MNHGNNLIFISIAAYRDRQLVPTIEDCIAHEKRLKRWGREWKFALIEQSNPGWRDLFERLI